MTASSRPAVSRGCPAWVTSVGASEGIINDRRRSGKRGSLDATGDHRPGLRPPTGAVAPARVRGKPAGAAASLSLPLRRSGHRAAGR